MDNKNNETVIGVSKSRKRRQRKRKLKHSRKKQQDIEWSTIQSYSSKRRQRQQRLEPLQKIYSFIFFCGYLKNNEISLQIEIPNDIKCIIISYIHKYLIFGIGQNKCGQFGEPSYKTLKKWKRLRELELLMNHYNDIYKNYKSLTIKTSNNKIFVVGYNKYGRLGIAASNDTHCNKKWTKIYPKYANIISNSIGNQYHTFIRTNNKLYVSGNNKYGCFGNGNIGDIGKLKCSFNDDFVDIQCGKYHTIFLTKNGNVYFCGKNKNNEYIEGRKNILTPTIIDVDIKMISVGLVHTVLLTKNDKIKVLGMFANALKLNGFNSNMKIVSIVSGYYHILCLSDQHKSYSFGYNNDCQIGNDDETQEFVGKPYYIEIGKDIIKIECGGYHSLLLSKDNTLYTFGNNSYNQCSAITNDIKLKTPYLFDKIAEIQNNYFIQQVIGLNYETLLIINPFVCSSMCFALKNR